MGLVAACGYSCPLDTPHVWAYSATRNRTRSEPGWSRARSTAAGPLPRCTAAGRRPMHGLRWESSRPLGSAEFVRELERTVQQETFRLSPCFEVGAGQGSGGVTVRDLAGVPLTPERSALDASTTPQY
jgi:hypothetical protein